ncbi:MAG: NapC/NirT family cytochrome c [Candidatus Eisenbacteria bacterium]
MQPELIALLVVSLALLLFLAVRPSVTRGPGGRALAFLGVFLLPGITLFAGFEQHMESSKTKQFCMTCHVMRDYGKSLMVDDNEYIPAVHYQNNYVPREKACFTCHTDYAMYGDLRAKLRGLRHLYVQYVGTVPDTIKLYTPFQNRECLHCHGESRKFLANSGHHDDDTTMVAMQSGRLSCMASGCHDVAHDVHELKGAPMWSEGTK